LTFNPAGPCERFKLRTWPSSHTPICQHPHHVGITTERERQLASAFIHIAGGADGAYGTRCSTVVVVEASPGSRTVHVTERTHDALGQHAAPPTQRFDLQLQRLA
jgi:uncharacterized protein with NRDE domain